MSRRFHPLVLIIIGLALFGFGHQLIFNTVQLLTQIAIFGAVGLLLFILYKRFMHNTYGGRSHRPKQIKRSNLMKTQKQPVKQTSPSNVISHRNAQNLKRTTNKSLNKRSTSPNLTVIEGRKGKKKNRALF